MVYVIVLNWNGWRDTIECLESLFRLNYHDYSVIVCDNHSVDGSMEKIAAWAEGSVTAECGNSTLRPLCFPPVPKPIPVSTARPGDRLPPESRGRLLLVQTGDNLGFAGGSNVGLRLALSTGDCDYAWLLNNDTVVDPDSLTQLVNRMGERPDAGLCGSRLMSYWNPELIQALGGSEFNRWLSRGRHIAGGLPFDHAVADPDQVERRLDYVVGASMLVRRAFLDQVGLLTEDYFLYFEEIDWALRGRARFQLAYAPGSVVYHKEGASTGSSVVFSRASPLSDFYASRNRLLLSRRYFPAGLPGSVIVIILKSLYAAARRRWKNSFALIRGAMGGLLGSLRSSSRA